MLFRSENCVYTGVGFHLKSGFKNFFCVHRCWFCVLRCRFSPQFWIPEHFVYNNFCPLLPLQTKCSRRSYYSYFFCSFCDCSDSGCIHCSCCQFILIYLGLNNSSHFASAAKYCNIRLLVSQEVDAEIAMCIQSVIVGFELFWYPAPYCKLHTLHCNQLTIYLTLHSAICYVLPRLSSDSKERSSNGYQIANRDRE